MLMDPMGGICMTNDGNAILREIIVQHGPGTETCSNDTGDCLCGGDVAELDFLPLFSF